MNWPLLVILFLITGFIFLLVEIFLVPGFGPVGIGAIFCLAAGAYLSWTKLSLTWALIVTFVSIQAVIASIIFLKKSGVTKKLILARHIGESSSSGETKSKGEKNDENSLVAIGDKGVAISDLRPSGVAQFHNCRLNVLTDGIYISQNTPIKITQIEGNRIFVEEYFNKIKED